MAKKTTKQSTDTDALQKKLFSEFDKSKNSMLAFRSRWEEFLDIAYARLAKTNGFKSRVREGTLSSILWDRTCKVVAQLPTGKIQALTQHDTGKSALMDIVWHKYVIPGADTDYSFFTKVRLWDYYSFVYGASPAFYDYRVDDEYVGPDWTVLDPRYVFPQAGRLSLQRCQYVFIEAYQNKEWLKAKIGQDGWDDKAINKILADYKDDIQPDNTRKQTNLQNERGQSIDLHRGELQLVTKYERGKKGRWITFAPQYDNAIVRDIPNPHKSGRIPVVFKYCFPLLDSIWGMGDVERGESLQKAVDTYVNLAMDFAKFKLYPPMYYTEGVNATQLRYEPSAKWKLPSADAAGFMPISGEYTQELTTGVQFLRGSLQTQNGTAPTNVSLTNSGDDQQGKTPQAIQANQSDENSRINWDRTMLEEALESISNGMINLIGTKQPASIDFHIFDEDIKKIADVYPDVLEIYDSAYKPAIVPDEEGNEMNPQLDMQLSGKGAAKITIGIDDLKGAFKYTLDSGTTMATDDKEEHDNLMEVANFLGTPAGQQIVQGMTQRRFDADEFMKRMLVNTGTQDWEEILPEVDQNQQQGQGQPQQFNPQMLQDPQLQGMATQGQPTQAVGPSNMQQAQGVTPSMQGVMQ